MRKFTAVWTTGLVLVFLLSACDTVNALDDANPKDSDQWVSPIVELLGSLWLEPTESAVRRFEAQQRFLQDYIANCMLQEGFEYLPDFSLTQFWSPSGSPEPYRPNDREWVIQYGYGIVSSGGARRGSPDEGLAASPNEAIIGALSDAEQAAYDVALNGELEDRFPAGVIMLTGSELIEARNNQGCSGRAANALDENESDDPRNILNSEEFRNFQEEIWAFQIALEQMPEREVIDTDWSFCMADAGHPNNARPSDAQFDILYADSLLHSRLAARGEDPDSSSEMRDLQSREIAIALADFDCRNKVDYWNRVNTSRFEMETRFIQDNKATFDAILDAMEQRQ